ncbi:hypothetical protein M513_12231 [Trichuris suis]|uniref:Uncharacterized protein n=1 Tax=Trichuris suis TaxID=68888 RepID=A0A085LPH7_9BILA|nr:hypothetical protein M513_12231 [Trichuris suis]
MLDERPDAVRDMCLSAKVLQTGSQANSSEPRCYACGGLNHFASDSPSRVFLESVDATPDRS